MWDRGWEISAGRWGTTAPPGLVEAGLLRICRRAADVREYMLEETRVRRTETEREAVRARFRSWLEMRTGGTRLAACALTEMLEAADG